MTVKEVAGKISGREYGRELLPEEEKELAKAGIVVVYGYSDDSVEFGGAVNCEIGCWEKIDIPIFDGKPFEPPCIDEVCPLLGKLLLCAKYIHAEFCDEGWRFSADFPHEKVFFYEDGEIFGEGLVYSLDGAKEGAQR